MTIWHEIIKELQGSQKGRRSPERILQGLIWLAHAFHLSSMGPREFAAKYLGHHKNNSTLIYKWLHGNTTPYPASVSQINKQLPGSGDIYHLPLFPLLAPRPISLGRVRKLLSIYENAGRVHYPWSFPNDTELHAQNRFVPVVARDDSVALFARGDLYGFTAIVGLVSEAEASGDAEAHWLHCANMFRALPAVARIPWIYPHYNRLRECVYAIYARNRTTQMIITVDWDIIDRQIQAPVHETIRERRPRDPKTYRFADLEDPVVYRWR